MSFVDSNRNDSGENCEEKTRRRGGRKWATVSQVEKYGAVYLPSSSMEYKKWLGTWPRVEGAPAVLVYSNPWRPTTYVRK